jgi:hypothetical protein
MAGHPYHLARLVLWEFSIFPSSIRKMSELLIISADLTLRRFKKTKTYTLLFYCIQNNYIIVHKIKII